MKNLPYDQAVDWWAVGIMVFEMMAGYPPFCSEDSDDDIAALDERIMNDEVDFPDSACMSPAAVLIIKKVSVIAIKSEALKCHSLLYALECNLPHLVLKHQEQD